MPSFVRRLLGLDDTKRCRVHDRELVPGVAEVRYGLIRFTPSYEHDRKTLFPNTNSFVLGGCLIGTQKEVDVTYCPDCRRAEENWKREHTAK